MRYVLAHKEELNGMTDVVDARSQGRIERNDRCGRWPNIVGANRRLANAKSFILQENNPDAASMLYVHYFQDYFDTRHFEACTLIGMYLVCFLVHRVIALCF